MNGLRNLTFSLYSEPVAGTPVWIETQTVLLQNGRFHVLLGSVNPVTSAVFASPNVYLGVKVGADTEMSPRSRMASVGYAFKAEDASSVNGLKANEISAANPKPTRTFFAEATCGLANAIVCQSACVPLVTASASEIVRIAEIF